MDLQIKLMLMIIQSKHIVIAILALLLYGKSSFSQHSTFQNGDKVCFIGNSITMSGSFHHYINLFYATRFPDRKITFFNCGVSGETAANILNRLDEDILVHKPDWCVLMVGSNDINGDLYSEASKNLPDLENLKQQALEKYYRNTTELIEKLIKANSKVIIEIPCIYDQTGKLKAENLYGSNDALKKCAVFLKDIALRHNLMVVDYWSITNDINNKLQEKDLSTTIISGDRTHPNKYGNFVMAYQFLRTQLGSGKVSELSADAKSGAIRGTTGCEISGFSATKRNISFSILENSIPFPDADNIFLDSLVRFTEEFNTQVVRIEGLKRGQYSLAIDSTVVGLFTAKQLAGGINLSKNKSTPQYVQSEKVLDLFNTYWSAVADLRAVKYVEYQHMRNLQNRDDMAAIKSFFDSSLAKNKSSDNYGFFTRMFEKYLLIKPQEKKLEERLPVILNDIYQAGAPRRHLYTIERKN